jgi:hypothetical protein
MRLLLALAPLAAGAASPPSCSISMQADCGPSRNSSVDCLLCLGEHQADLKGICNKTQLDQFCQTPGPPAPPGPGSTCSAQMQQDCAASRNSSMNCFICLGAHQADLQKAGCTHTQLTQFCQVRLTSDIL